MDNTERKNAFWRIMLPVLIVGGIVIIFQKGVDFGRWLYDLLN